MCGKIQYKSMAWNCDWPYIRQIFEIDNHSVFTFLESLILSKEKSQITNLKKKYTVDTGYNVPGI